MRNIITLFLMLEILSIFYGCNNSSNSDSTTYITIEKAYNNIEQMNKTALEDSTFKQKQEYTKTLEQANIEIAKHTSKLSYNQKLLFEYKISVDLLKNYIKKMQSNPELIKNTEYSKLIKYKADHVRDIYQKLKKANLNLAEIELFENINRK